MIKKGDAFVCINTVIMDENPNDIAYDKGRIYHSEEDGCITDNNHIVKHEWGDDFCEDFVKLEDREIVHNENVIKYVLRSGRKAEQGISVDDKAVEDLKKARFYLDDEIKRREL